MFPSLLSPMLSPLIPVTPFVPTWLIALLIMGLGGFLWVSRWPGRDAKVKPIRASSFTPEKVPAKLDTIVIGSGSGGSSCANILAQSGQRVLLLQLVVLCRR